MRMVAKELPGIGWGRSQDVDKAFRSVREMVAADEKTWLGIPGIGKGIAGKVVRALRGGKA